MTTNDVDKRSVMDNKNILYELTRLPRITKIHKPKRWYGRLWDWMCRREG